MRRPLGSSTGMYGLYYTYVTYSRAILKSIIKIARIRLSSNDVLSLDF